MPYQAKNKFMILGLTGPLGSGCTSTAKFLSGMPSDSQHTIKDLMHIQTGQLEDINKNIGNIYEIIFNAKKSVRNRLSKRLGEYKKSWINPDEDEKIKENELEIKKEYSKLKFYLKRREIYNTLNSFLISESSRNDNTNEYDKKAFGYNSYCYISFTTIIVKLAIEQYIQDGGVKELDNYFNEKIKLNTNNLSIDSYKNIKSYIKRKFKFEEDIKKAYRSSNNYIQNRVYQFSLHAEFLGNEKLKNKFNQNMSKFYISFFDYIITINKILSDIKKYISKKDKDHYILFSEILQDWGDNIRGTGNPFKANSNSDKHSYENLFKISHEINLLIKSLRFRIRYLDKNFRLGNKSISEPDCLFVIECFRNPYEIDFFRSRYAEFYLLSISAKKSIREKRVGKNFSTIRDKRDEGASIKAGDMYKLDVRSCVLLSDIAILNDHGGKQKFFEKILRFIALIRNPGCIPPNDDELYMHIAYSHSLKSTCISRKVGAVIIGPKGYIFGAGWNNPGDGQVGCGMRHKDDLLNIDYIPLTTNTKDLTKFKRIISENSSKYICYKDVMSEIYTDQKLNKFIENCPENCITKISSEIGIKRLEYCRALHAEENAILQSAKIGGMPIERGTIYTTTYPCELCAKKLYQIGIRTIYYTEPYPESISEQVFLEDGTKTVERIPFEGVKSYSFFRLFKSIYDKKELLDIAKHEEIQ
jgi:deoxycytidylate deaminase